MTDTGPVGYLRLILALLNTCDWHCHGYVVGANMRKLLEEGAWPNLEGMFSDFFLRLAIMRM